MKKKYSEILEAESGRKFRYNFETAMLEYVSVLDYQLDDDSEELTVTPLEEPEVIASVGLREVAFNENPEYWIEVYDNELDQEIAGMY